MHVENETLVTVLNHLIAVVKDSENAYREAAELAQDSALQIAWRRYEQERGEFAAALQAEVRAYSAEPADAGSVSGALHRGWLAVRHALAPKSGDAAILEGLEAQESAAFEAFAQARNAQLPPRLRALVGEQAAAMARAQEYWRARLHLATH